MKQIQLVCEARIALEQDANEAVSPSGKIEAQVTTWGAREGADGRRFNYQPEGFADWAKEFSSSDKPLPMFLNHNDLGMPVGQWTEFKFTENGLNARGQLYLNTVGGSDVYSILKESPKMFGGVSVGAYAEEARYVDATGEECAAEEEEAFFQITKGGLKEVSIVMYPNNPKAEIQKLEAFNQDGELNPRVLEKALRDAGLSKKDATTASCLVKKLLAERDVEPVRIDETPSQREAGAVDQLLAALQLRELTKELDKRIVV